MKEDRGNNPIHSISQYIIGTNPKKRFIKFISLIIIGWATGYLAIRRGIHLTPELFKNYVLSLGIIGPIIYIGRFFYEL